MRDWPGPGNPESGAVAGIHGADEVDFAEFDAQAVYGAGFGGQRLLLQKSG